MEWFLLRVDQIPTSDRDDESVSRLIWMKRNSSSGWSYKCTEAASLGYFLKRFLERRLFVMGLEMHGSHQIVEMSKKVIRTGCLSQAGPSAASRLRTPVAAHSALAKCRSAGPHGCLGLNGAPAWLAHAGLGVEPDLVLGVAAATNAVAIDDGPAPGRPRSPSWLLLLRPRKNLVHVSWIGVSRNLLQRVPTMPLAGGRFGHLQYQTPGFCANVSGLASSSPQGLVPY
jgi:hypothetical protein